MDFENLTVTPIARLRPHIVNWILQVRVTVKTVKKFYNTNRGRGSFFAMDLIDQSGEIRCVAFNDECDKYYHKVHVGNVYFITGGKLKIVDKRYSVLKNEYEIIMRYDTELLPCFTDNHVPQTKFNFVCFDDIEPMEHGTIIDILGVIQSVGELSHIKARSNGNEYTIREVYIVDESNCMVTLTLWDDQAIKFDANSGSVLVAKHIKVSEYMGNKSLSPISRSILQIDPDLQSVHAIRKWYNSIGINESFLNISQGDVDDTFAPRLTIREAKRLYYDQPDEKIYVTKATVGIVSSDSCLYQACPSKKCWKKVNETQNGMFRCEKCDSEYPNFTWRIIARVNLSDWSDDLWVTAFNDHAEELLGESAEELAKFKVNNYDTFLEKLDKATMKTYIFKLRVKIDTFNGVSNLRTSILNITKLNTGTHCAQQLQKIRQIIGIEKV